MAKTRNLFLTETVLGPTIVMLLTQAQPVIDSVVTNRKFTLENFWETVGIIAVLATGARGRYKAGGVHTPRYFPGRDPDSGDSSPEIPDDTTRATAAATAIGIPKEIVPPIVQQATSPVLGQLAPPILNTIPPPIADEPACDPPLSRRTGYSPIVIPGYKTITLLSRTTGKQSTAQALTLSPDYLADLMPGVYSVVKIEPKLNERGDFTRHYEVTFPQPIKGFNTWLIFEATIAPEDRPAPPVRMAPQTVSGDVDLAVPYLTQLDNATDSKGQNIRGSSCNVTCAAMAVRYYGKVGNGDGQLENQMWEWLLERGLNYGNGDHIDALIESYGLVDDFSKTATLDDIDRALRQGCPTILQGWFTPPGHFVLVKGIYGSNYIVHDPVGLWDGRVRGSYNYDVSGANVLYSRDSISRACDDNGIYLHVISRPK